MQDCTERNIEFEVCSLNITEIEVYIKNFNASTYCKEWCCTSTYVKDIKTNQEIKLLEHFTSDRIK